MKRRTRGDSPRYWHEKYEPAGYSSGKIYRKRHPYERNEVDKASNILFVCSHPEKNANAKHWLFIRPTEKSPTFILARLQSSSHEFVFEY